MSALLFNCALATSLVIAPGQAMHGVDKHLRPGGFHILGNTMSQIENMSTTGTKTIEYSGHFIFNGRSGRI